MTPLQKPPDEVIPTLAESLEPSHPAGAHLDVPILTSLSLVRSGEQLKKQSFQTHFCLQVFPLCLAGSHHVKNTGSTGMSNNGGVSTHRHKLKSSAGS